MERILVVGATGQVGRAVVRKLVSRGASVRSLIRGSERAAEFQRLGTDPVIGDLTDSSSLMRACAGMKTIIATANAAVPTRSADTFEAVELKGYRNLIHAAKASGVRRFVYTSMPLSATGERLSPFVRYKREIEQSLLASGLDFVIFRAGIFMDVSFAMMGSAIPLQGSEDATVLRPFGFANRHFARIRDSIEKKHTALIPGDGTTRHAFVCAEDVAAFLAAAATSGSGTYTLGGPEALTFLDVVAIYERILGITLKVQRAPAIVFRLAVPLLRPFSPAGSNIMALNYIAATENSFGDPTVAEEFGIPLTSAEAFLRGKHALAATV